MHLAKTSHLVVLGTEMKPSTSSTSKNKKLPSLIIESQWI